MEALKPGDPTISLFIGGNIGKKRGKLSWSGFTPLSQQGATFNMRQ